jgi:excisionase family DNA binding protein
MSSAIATADPPRQDESAWIPGDPMLSARQIAELLGVTAATVLDWRKNGALPGGVRIGRTIRWPRTLVVRALLNASETQQ